ncbi:MAG: LCP family protein [Actinomycetota bacterium]|nr:LCP family protein [Actinomycetota bacterium]
MPQDAKTGRWTKVFTIVLATAILAATLVGAGVNLLLGRLQGNITAVDVSEQVGTADQAPEPIAVLDDATGTYTPLNVVLIGSDTRVGKDNRGYGKASELTGQRSDTTILLHVSADRKSAIAVSIPRDTLITLPKCKKDGKATGGYQGRFNEAIQLGGPGCTIKAIEELTGLELSNFMLVDFGGFKRIVDAVGGVEICVSEAVNDPLSKLVLEKGKHIVQGEQALAFVRARKTLGDGSDTSRIRRQQAFLSSLVRSVLSSGTLLNPATMLSILDAATQSLTADPQLADIQNLQDLALSMKDLKPNNITFVTMPWYPSGDGATVLPGKKKGAPIWDAIANDTPWPPSGATGEAILKVRPEMIRVNILNGTSTKGMAKKVAKQLSDQGFRIGEVGNADSNAVAITTVQYDPRWDISAKTLIAAAEATGKSIKKSGQTMTLIIGSDFTAIMPVEVSDIAEDKTANINTADESFCAE